MPKDIIINSATNEVRVAVLDSGSVSEIFIERTRNKGTVGNIYKGKVVKVLPGMQSAFVDIGLSKAAFLHVADICVEGNDFFPSIEERVSDVIEESSIIDDETKPKEIFAPIEDIITEGQTIIVQIAKEPIGQKGARVTTHLTIPGRYLVLMPSYNHIGVSRRIENEGERERLKGILNEIKPDGIGLIARTVCEGSSKDDLKSDLDYLLRTWNKINAAIKKSPSSVLYEDLDIIYRTLRDYTNDDVKKIIVDSKQELLKIKEFVREFLPGANILIELYEGEIPIFDYYNIEIEINRLTDRRVWLKSGGYIVIDQAEALTVIDVNTGKYVGKRNFEETVLKTNIEAAKEIAWQLKLRNIGGIIIVDFIDMERAENREKVLKTLEDEFIHDRAKATVVNISPLGLFEITRKRVQESLTKTLTESCPYCEGRGVVKSKITVCYDILRELRRISPYFSKRSIMVEAHPEIVDMILSYERENIDDIELIYNIKVEVKSNSSYHLEHYEVIPY